MSLICANPYLNAVLAQYTSRLEELEAKYTMNIQVREEDMPYMELCQILSNGLDNTCNALKGLVKEKREASVQMKYSRSYILIRIRNRCRDDLSVEKGTIPTTEKKERGHGFGLTTVQEAAGRLGGDMFCYTENGSFVLDVMVPCQLFPKG